MTEQKIEMFKAMSWDKMDVDAFITRCNNVAFIGEIMEIDTDTIKKCSGKNGVCCDFIYRKDVGPERKNVLFGNVITSNDNGDDGDMVYTKDIEFFSDDALGLFSPGEPKELDAVDNFKDALRRLLDEKSNDEVIDILIDSDDDLWNDITNYIEENMDDSEKEDVARDWIRDNAADAYEYALCDMDSYEIKDKIIDYLSDNL